MPLVTWMTGGGIFTGSAVLLLGFVMASAYEEEVKNAVGEVQSNHRALKKIYSVGPLLPIFSLLDPHSFLSLLGYLTRHLPTPPSGSQTG